MPSITLGHLYTFIALFAVSGLLTLSFAAYTNALRSVSETKRLENVMNHLAVQATELLTLALTTDAEVERFVEMPNAIGTKQYWLVAGNDSESVWLRGGLGSIPADDSALQVFLPGRAAATGYYISQHGTAILTCSLIDGLPELRLSNSGGVD